MGEFSITRENLKSFIYPNKQELLFQMADTERLSKVESSYNLMALYQTCLYI